MQKWIMGCEYCELFGPEPDAKLSQLCMDWTWLIWIFLLQITKIEMKPGVDVVVVT